MGVGGQRHVPSALPPGKTQYPLHRRLVGPQGLSGRVRKISPPPGFDPRTAQPVVRSLKASPLPARSVMYVCVHMYIFIVCAKWKFGSMGILKRLLLSYFTC
jgi:hypothetical protein